MKITQEEYLNAIEKTNDQFSNILDKIRTHYELGDAIRLNKQEQDCLERWNFVDNLIRKAYKEKSVVNLLKLRYKISTSTAYRDIANAKALFGSMAMVDKEYETMLQLEWTNKAIRICFENNDMRNMPRLLEERRKLLDLDGKNELNNVPIELLTQREIIVQFNKNSTYNLSSSTQIPFKIKEQIIQDADVLTNSSDDELYNILKIDDEQ